MNTYVLHYSSFISFPYGEGVSRSEAMRHEFEAADEESAKKKAAEFWDPRKNKEGQNFRSLEQIIKINWKPE